MDVEVVSSVFNRLDASVADVVPKSLLVVVLTTLTALLVAVKVVVVEVGMSAMSNPVTELKSMSVGFGE